MSDTSKHTGEDAANAASKVLKDGRTGTDSKSAAGSAMAQAGKEEDKITGKEAASSASEVLRSDDTGDNSKTAAASALSQKEKKSS